MSLIWNGVPPELNLPKNEIHVWLLDNNDFLQYLELFRSYLSDDELSRMNRYKFDRLRKNFLINRGFLKHLLSQYLQIDNRDLEFDYSSKGKPSLKDKNINSNFHFNLSHKENYTIYAFSDRPVGIDLEVIKNDVQVEQLVQRFFTESELQDICSLNESEKLAYFFQLWTAKEAYLKLTGEGLSGGLDSINLQKSLSDLDWQFELENKGGKAPEDDRFLGQIKTWQILPEYYTSIAVDYNDKLCVYFYQAGACQFC